MAIWSSVKRVGIIAGWQGGKPLLEQAITDLHKQGVNAIIGVDDILHGPQWRECIDVLNARENGVYAVTPRDKRQNPRPDDAALSSYLQYCSDVDHDFLRNGMRHGIAYLNPLAYAGRLEAFGGDRAIRTDEQARIVFGWMAEQDYALQIVGGGAPAAWRFKGGVLSSLDATQPIILEKGARHIVSPGTLAGERRYCVIELGDHEKGESERIEPRTLRGG